MADKNGGAIFFKARRGEYRRALRTVVEMRAQFVDRGKPHHAFRHLRLDRTVGIKRVGHAVDHA